MAITICTVSGSLKDLSDNAVNGLVKAYAPPFFHGTELIATEAMTTIDSDGDFEIELAETASVSKTVTFEIEYYLNGVQKKKLYSDVTVPNQATANLSDIV